MRRYLTGLVAAGWVVASVTAHAGLFDDDEARAQVVQLRTQLSELSKQAEILSRNQLDFANQMESIKAEMAKMRGQIEVLTYDLEAAQKRQKDFYVDLDNRLRKLETAPEVTAEAVAPKVDPAKETQDYETAVSALKASKFKPAAEGFVAFIKTYPQSSLLGSAHYWGGYANAQLKDHLTAAEMFGKFAAGWPDDDRVPSALESRAYALEATKNVKGARDVLEQLATKYPASDAGKRAKLRLTRK